MTIVAEVNIPTKGAVTTIYGIPVIMSMECSSLEISFGGIFRQRMSSPYATIAALLISSILNVPCFYKLKAACPQISSNSVDVCKKREILPLLQRRIIIDSDAITRCFLIMSHTLQLP